MKPHRLPAVFAALLAPATLLALACEDKKAPEPPPAPSATASATVALPVPSATASSQSVAMGSALPMASAAVAPVVLHFRAGPAALFVDAAQGLDLEETPRLAVEKLSDQLDADEDDAPRGDLKTLHDDIVAAVRAGAVDTAKLLLRAVALQKIVQGRLDKEAATLNALHAALSPESRHNVITEVQRRTKERELDVARMAGDAGTEDIAERAKRRPDRLKKELALEDAQKAKLDPILARLPADNDSRADGKKRLDALLAAFDGPKLDAKKLDAFGPAAAKARVPMDREIAFLAQLVPILTSEQREALAGRLEGERLRSGTGAPRTAVRDWPYPFEIEAGDVVGGLTGTKPRGKAPKGTPVSPPPPPPGGARGGP